MDEITAQTISSRSVKIQFEVSGCDLYLLFYYLCNREAFFLKFLHY